MRQQLAAVALTLAAGAAGRAEPLGAQAAPDGAARDGAAPDSAALLRARADSAAARQAQPALREAAALWTRAAAWYARTGRPADRAQMLHNAGRAYANLAAPDSALARLGEALAMRRDAGDRRGQGATLGMIGNVHRSQGRADSALRYYAAALEHQRALGDRGPEGVTLLNMGAVYRDLGRPSAALRYYRQALAIHRALRARAAEGVTLGNIGAVYADLGWRDSVVSYYRGALAIQREARARAAEGGTLGNLGAAYADSDRPDSAVVYYQAALAIHREVGNRRLEAAALNNIGVAYQRLGAPDSSVSYGRQALAVAAAAGDRHAAGTALNNLGAVQADLGRADSAAAYYRRALDVRRAVGDRRGEAQTLTNLGRLSLEQPLAAGRDAARAVAYLDSAAAVYAAMRRDAGSDPNAVTFAEQHRELFARWTLAWLARADAVGAGPSARAALAAADRGRAQGLLDLQRTSAGGGAPDARASDAARPGADLTTEADALLAPARRAATAVLSYLVTGDTLVRWLALPAGELRVSRVAVSRDSLAVLVGALRADLAVDEGPGAGGRARGRAALDRAAGLLLPAELRARVPAGAGLVVVPHGALVLVPFAALPAGPGGQPLGIRYAVRSAPSLAALAAAESRPALPPVAVATAAALTRGGGRAAAGPALVVGNPAAPELLPPLPGAEREARRLAGLLGVRPLVGAEATESAVRARLASAPLAHFATHAVAFSTGAQARESYLALAADSVSDGALTAGELLEDPALALRADLVVLSACRTALGNLTQAEGAVGLARAFLARGARSVLVSLWDVPDDATDLLMRRFYAHWLRDADRPDKAEALRRAQADVRGTPRFADPRNWAAFTLVGAA